MWLNESHLTPQEIEQKFMKNGYRLQSTVD